MRVFLSYSFSAHGDRPLVSEIEDVIRSHGIRLVTGRSLGGGPLTGEIRRRILTCNALVALASRREPAAAPGKWRTHPWVRDEVQFARDHDKPAMVLFETEVEIDAGFYAEHEYTLFDRADPTAALLNLSKTLGVWRDAAGRPLKVLLQPADVVSGFGHDFTCRVRFYDEGAALEWQDAEPVIEDTGTFLYLDGVRDEYRVQVEVRAGRQVFSSRVTPQSMPVRLE